MAVGAQTNFELLTGLSEDLTTDSTLVRVRGELVVWRSTRAGVADEMAIWYAGITAGHENIISATPDPELDDADWLWYNTGYVLPATRSDGGVDKFEIAPRFIMIDNKSMRKLPVLESSLVFAFKNDASSDLDVEVGLAVRMLLLLH